MRTERSQLCWTRKVADVRRVVCLLVKAKAYLKWLDWHVIGRCTKRSEVEAGRGLDHNLFRHVDRIGTDIRVDTATTFLPCALPRAPVSQFKMALAHNLVLSVVHEERTHQ